MNPCNDRAEIDDQNDTRLRGCHDLHSRGIRPVSCLGPERKPREGVRDWFAVLLFAALASAALIAAWTYGPEIRAWIERMVRP